MTAPDEATEHVATFINAGGDDLLLRVARSALLHQSLDDGQRAAVVAAQERHSWAEIGEALGISKQAAHRKFVTYIADELKAKHRDMKSARRAGQAAKFLSAHDEMAAAASRLRKAQHGG